MENYGKNREILGNVEQIEQLRKRKIELERMTAGERLRLLSEQGMKKKCELEIASAKNAGNETQKPGILSVILQKKKELPVLEQSLREIEERTEVIERSYSAHREELKTVTAQIAELETLLGADIEKRYHK